MERTVSASYGIHIPDAPWAPGVIYIYGMLYVHLYIQ